MASRHATPTLMAAWVLASLLSATAAHADPTSADRETARTLMQQGREARDKGDLKEALKRFKGADDIMHVPTTALEVARAQVALGQFVEARDFIAEIRQIPPKPNEPAPFKEARKKADDLDASLNGRIPSLHISVTGGPDGAEATVTVDGVQLPAGALELPRTVDPGHHVVAVKVTTKTAVGEGSQEVDVREGETKPVEVALTMTAVEQPPEPPAPEPSKPETPPPPTHSHSPTVMTWAGVGLGVVGVAAGTVTGILTLSKKSTLKSECGPSNSCPPGTATSDLNSANSFATVSTIGFIVAGVGAGVAVVTLLVGHDEQAAPPASTPPQTDSGLVVRPWIGLGAAGVGGRF
jgi:hypothetical protein